MGETVLWSRRGKTRALCYARLLDHYGICRFAGTGTRGESTEAVPLTPLA
jgi:hypothetical protein